MKLKNCARLLINAVVAISLCGFVLSCGGGGDSDSGGAPGQTGTVTLSVANSSLPADGSSSTTIRASIKDSSGGAVRHYTEVIFTTNLGHFRNGSTRYTMQTQPPLGEDGFPNPDAPPTGIAEVQFIAGTTPGAAKITVTSNGVTNSIYISLTGVSGAIVLSASPASISADGSSSSIITATLTDSGGNPVTPGTAVAFQTGLGQFPNGEKVYSVQTPDTTGIVQVSLQAGLVPGSTYLIATSNSVSQTLKMVLQKLEPSLSQISVVANPSTIPGNGTSQSVVTANVTRINQTLSAASETTTPIQGIPVTFYDVSGAVQPDPLPPNNTFTGTGDDVTTIFYNNGGTIKFTMTSPEPYWFTVVLWNSDTAEAEAVLFDDFGPVVNKTAIVNVPIGNYFLNVSFLSGSNIASWSIKMQGAITTAQVEGDSKFLAFGKTDAQGNAKYIYTSTAEKKIVTIKVETGQLSNSDDALNSQVSITQTAGPSASISLNEPTPVWANGENQTTVKATVKDALGNLVEDGTVVSFSATVGVIEANAETKDGVASANLTAVSSATSVTSTVTATVGTLSTNTTATFRGVSLTNMQATPAAIFANGTDKSTITVRLEDSSGVAIAGETIVFSTTGGTLTSAAANTDTQGVAETELVAPTTTGTATISAIYGTITANTTISFEASGVGSITLTASPTSIPADGTSSSTITATVTSSSGAAVPKGTSVTFATDLGTFSNGAQTYTVITPTETGVVSVALIAGTTDGAAKITASAVNTSQTVYVYIGGEPVSITLVADPTSIPADGSSSSTITATLKDSTGTPVTPGTSVTFSTNLGTFSGGGTTHTVTTPDATGIVSVSLISATTSGFATVTATANGTTQSVTVGFTGGDVGSITLTADPTTIPADGASSSAVTATIKDPAGGPVPQGTSATFTTNLGTFSNGSTTQTVTTLDATGTVTVSLIAGTTAGTAEVLCVSSGVSQKVTIQITGGAGTPASLSLGLSQTSVKSDNSDSSTITATVLDVDKAALEGIVVAFSASGGQISASSAETDANGQAQITFSSGTTDPANRTVTITATVSGLTPETIPIEVTGSTLTLSTDKTTITDDGSTTASLTVTAANAGGTGVYNAAVTFAVTGTGGATVTPSTGNTNVSGQLTVTVIGTSAGSVTVTATGLGTTATQAYTVTGAGTGFAIVLPTSNPFSTRTRTTASLVTAQPPTSITFNDNGATVDTITSAGAFGAYVAGDVIMVGGSTSNDGVYTLSSTTAPTANTLTLVTSDSLTAETSTSVVVTNGVLVRVRAPGLTNVVFATTIGVWDGGLSPITTKAVASDYVWAVLTSDQAGSATVQVYDDDDSTTTDKTTVAFSAPSADAAKITLQASTYVVAPSTGGNTHTATLTATVRSAGGQVVGGAAVAFSIENPTGGGETVSPVVVLTDISGVAKTTFTSGSLSSGAEGVTVNARVIGEGETTSKNTIAFSDSNPDTITRTDGGSFITDGFELGEEIRVQGSTTNDGYYTLSSTTAPTANVLTLVAADSINVEGAGATVTITAVTTSVSIVIGGTAGSVVIGRGTKIYEQDDATYYIWMSVLVSDSNGNPKNGAVVSLSAWPTQYSSGVWYDTNPSTTDEFVTYTSGTFDNEDVNENLILDPGEDTNGDGKLTPPSSAAGDVPTTVTTEENGVAQFKLVFLKASSRWIIDRIRASTVVLGTEMTSSLVFRLPAEKVEAEAGYLPDSAYPVGLVTSTSASETYTFPVFMVSATDYFGTMSSLSAGASSVVSATRIYTYNPTGGTQASVGNWVWDWISVANSTGAISAYFPVRIIIQ